MYACAFVSRSLFLGLLVSLLAVAMPRAQSCPKQTAGAPGSTGLCSGGGIPRTNPTTPGFPGERPGNARVTPTTGGGGPTCPIPGGPDRLDDPNGSVDQATGAYRFEVGLAAAGGLSPSASVDVSALYRSYLATGNGKDPTGGG